MSNLSDIFNPVNKAMFDLQDKYHRDKQTFNDEQLTQLEQQANVLRLFAKFIKENPNQQQPAPTMNNRIPHKQYQQLKTYENMLRTSGIGLKHPTYVRVKSVLQADEEAPRQNLIKEVHNFLTTNGLSVADSPESTEFTVFEDKVSYDYD